jgi:hypothetical protein
VISAAVSLGYSIAGLISSDAHGRDLVANIDGMRPGR